MRAALLKIIAERRYQPFEMGVNDCCLWTADAVHAMGARDFAADIRGYATDMGALRKLKAAGYDSVAQLIANRLVRTRRPRLGVIVLLDNAPLNSLLICEDARTAWGQGEQGLQRIEPPNIGATFWEPEEWVR